MPRDTIDHLNPISHVIRVSIVEIVTMFQMPICGPRVDTCGMQSWLNCMAVEVSRRIDMPVQLRPYVSGSPPHAHSLMPDIMRECTQVPHL